MIAHIRVGESPANPTGSGRIRSDPANTYRAL
jgi:hypothetical protein